MAEKKGFHIGRKFIAFLICLIALIVLGIFDKGKDIAPFIIALYASYVTGNVTQKATAKSENIVTVEGSDER